ncbi:unknown [Clostridium sp. CAG:568]|nr:unknown [Clostridium sp. CAG:568]
MQEAVKRFVKECYENSSKEGDKVKPHGLTLIDMPTGSGKTYNTIQLISKFLK